MHSANGWSRYSVPVPPHCCHRWQQYHKYAAPAWQFAPYRLIHAPSLVLISKNFLRQTYGISQNYHNLINLNADSKSRYLFTSSGFRLFLCCLLKKLVAYWSRTSGQQQPLRNSTKNGVYKFNRCSNIFKRTSRLLGFSNAKVF